MKLAQICFVGIVSCSLGVLAEETAYTPQLEKAMMVPDSAEQERPHRISLDVVGAAFGSYTLRYEYALLPYLTLQVPLYVQSFALAPWYPKVIRPEVALILQFADFIALTGLGAKFNWFGFYLQPTVRMGPARFDYKGRVGTRYAFAVEPSATVGYQNVFDGGVYMDVGFSFGSRFYKPRVAKNAEFRSELLFALGYAF